MSEKNIKVLMTGAGAPGAAGILHCLNKDPRISVVAADAREEAYGRYLADTFELLPLANQPEFAEQVLQICQKHSIQIILPLVTRELIPLALHKAAFEKAGIRIPVSPLNALEIANNKGKLYQFLQWRGMDLPDFRIVENPAQFKTAIEDLGYPGKPVCFKPVESNGSRGFRIIQQSVNEPDLLLNQKPSSVYISLEEAIRILSSGTFPELLIAEYLPGDEYSVDCLANKGEPVLVVPRLRKKMINGISVEGIFVKEETIIAYCSQIIRELQLHGNIGIQVKANLEGKFLVLEINPRVQGTISAGLGAGINLPLLAIKQELGLPIDAAEMAVQWGTRFSRYWQEVFY
ncbi:MAG: ATP-grasp domain-containing protein [Chitinophagaceae bacterium]|nr:ATP-grasp domain-containing protein [Chitinophagaceae bacterium]